MSRYYGCDPQEVRLSVSAVVRRVPGGRELLLMQRSDNAHWGLPGGYVEPGESVGAAAVREVYEETGVPVVIGRLVGVYSEPGTQVIVYPDGRRVQSVNLCFEAEPDGTPGDPTTPDETLATGYFPHDALPQPLVPIHRMRIDDALEGDPVVRLR